MARQRKLFGKTEVIYFIGIGGSGMSGIAEIVLNLGYQVQGSDIARSDVTKRLSRLGAKIFIGHKAENISHADVVVYSSAVNYRNPEMKKARELKIPIIPRAEMLAELMRLKRGIAVAGTHGKTSTSSIIGNIFNTAGLKPTTIIGGKVFNLGANARLGKGDFLICEADESDGSFLRLTPEINIITNIDNDHLDFYKDMKTLKKAFIEFINQIPFYGFSVVCLDDRNIRSILPRVKTRIITYGFDSHADFSIENIHMEKTNTVFDLRYKNHALKKLKINRTGKHNVLNSTAAIIVALELNLPLNKIQKGLLSFKGVERRMENIGTVRQIRIMDDYGHHPTEIKATLQAVSMRRDYKKLIVIFQPHRYSRTKLLYRDFGPVFSKADHLILTEIYAASEKKIPGVTSQLIYTAVKKQKKTDIIYVKNKQELLSHVKKLAAPGDIVMTLGAGDIKYFGKELLKELKI